VSRRKSYKKHKVILNTLEDSIKHETETGSFD
jgi:hypothetical protein